MLVKAYRAFKDPKLPKDIFRIEIFFLRLVGIELIRNETFLYKIYSRTLLFLLMVVFTGSEVYELIAQWPKINIIIAICNYLITHIMGIIKVTLLFINRKRFGKMLQNLQKPPFAPDFERGGDEEERLIRNYVRVTELQLFVYFFVVSGTIFTGLINVTLSRLNDPPGEWIFPYAPTMTFMELNYSPVFEIFSFLQFSGIVIFAIAIATTYVLLSVIIGYLSIQMKILGNAFRTLDVRSKKMFEQNPRKSLKFYLDLCLKNTMEHHLQLYELGIEMENLCNMMILVVFFCSVILMCFVLYSASLYPIGSGPFLQNGCFWFIVLCQVGMYCFWGHQASLQADLVADAVYETTWYDMPTSVSKALIMVIQRAHRPLYITAGKFVPLSMTTLMSIVKGSVSYFMILQQTTENSN